MADALQGPTQTGATLDTTSNGWLDSIFRSGASIFGTLQSTNAAESADKLKAKQIAAAQAAAQQQASTTTKLLIGGGIIVALIVIVTVVFKRR